MSHIHINIHIPYMNIYIYVIVYKRGRDEGHGLSPSVGYAARVKTTIALITGRRKGVAAPLSRYTQK